MPRKLNEHIVAIPAIVLEEYHVDNLGIVSDFQLKQKDIILAQREFLETTNDFRQVLPVVVFTHKGLVWAYKRTKKGNEQGLHDQVSVAVGGHWDLEDIISESMFKSNINVDFSLEVALDREISEEVDLQSLVLKKSQLCTLAASVTEVDKKHLAIIQCYELLSMDIESSEDELESMGFLHPNELLEKEKSGEITLETWAQVACKTLLDK